MFSIIISSHTHRCRVLSDGVSAQHRHSVLASAWPAAWLRVHLSDRRVYSPSADNMSIDVVLVAGVTVVHAARAYEWSCAHRAGRHEQRLTERVGCHEPRGSARRLRPFQSLRLHRRLARWFAPRGGGGDHSGRGRLRSAGGYQPWHGGRERLPARRQPRRHDRRPRLALADGLPARLDRALRPSDLARVHLRGEAQRAERLHRVVGLRKQEAARERRRG